MEGTSVKQSYVVNRGNKGNKEVVWWNTNIDKPNLQDIIEASEKEFPGVPKGKLHLLAGFMSLTMKESSSILQIPDSNTKAGTQACFIF